MKKLLSILGAMTLIGTTSAIAVACGGENPTPPTPYTTIDISNKITSPLHLGQLSANTKVEFLAKLQTALTQISGLNTIQTSDYDVYKARTTTAIQDSDITAGNSLNIKILTKGNKFKGNKDNITTNYTQKDTLNIEVEKQLKLINEKGEGVQTASLDTTVKDNVTWTVEALKKPINASQLLRTENKAANEACFDFITNSLKVKPKQGTTFEDGVFDKTTLEQIIGIVTDIKPDLVKTDDSKDYAITGGNFSFQFKKGKEKISDAYNIKLKTDKTKGVIAADFSKIVTKIAIKDTDVVTNQNILFIKDGAIPKSAKKGVTIGIVDITDNGKQFLALNKITGLNIIAQFDSRNLGTHWNKGDWLKISYKNTDVNFDPDKTFTKFTIN